MYIPMFSWCWVKDRQTDKQTSRKKFTWVIQSKLAQKKRILNFLIKKSNKQSSINCIDHCSSGCRGTAKEQVCMNPSLLFQEIGSTGIWRALELRTWLQDCQKKRKYFRIKNNSRSFSASHLPSSLHGVFSSSDMDRVDILHLWSR